MQTRYRIGWDLTGWTVIDTASGQLAELDGLPLIGLWLDRDKAHVAAAFEVEHSTSIYSGVVRMLDLALGTEAHALV